jgi:hypothetical protein
MAALRVLIGWVVVIGVAVYALRNPEVCMQAVADVIEAITRWLGEQLSSN